MAELKTGNMMPLREDMVQFSVKTIAMPETFFVMKAIGPDTSELYRREGNGFIPLARLTLMEKPANPETALTTKNGK